MRPGFTNVTPESHKPVAFWQRLSEPHSSLTETGTKRLAQLIAVVALVLTIINTAGAVTSYLATGKMTDGLFLLFLAVFSGIGYGLARRRRYRAGGYLIVGVLTVSAFANPFGAETVSNSLYIYLIAAIVFASISFPFWHMLFYVIFCSIVIPLLPLFYPEYTNVWFDLAIFFPFGALILTSMRYRDNVERDRIMEATAINREIQDVKDSLEIRLEERTKQLEEQTLRLRIAVDIAKDAASARNVAELLERAGQLIHERFGFYHTGIFMLDSNREFAILSASPTEAGRQMIADGYRLRVGEAGIVGKTASSGNPHIALDTGLDAIHFNNPHLPNTHSEMALPLKVENNTIGILDVQSDQPQAFNKDDVTIMQMLADQLATAIERTRLLQQVEENFKELEKAYGRTTRDSWKTLAESGLISNFGYRFDNVRIQPINEVTKLGAEAMNTGKVIAQNDSKQTGQGLTAIPIKLRGQPIGVVTVKLKEGYNPHTINTIEQAVERLAGSLESARLFEEARLRADREQAIAQITTSISTANEFDSILRTTVEEIGKSLGDSEVGIQIIIESEDQ